MAPKEKTWIQGTVTLVALALTIGCNGIGTNGGGGGNNKLAFTGCYAPNANDGNVGCGLPGTLGDSNSDSIFQGEISYQQSFWNGVPGNVHLGMTVKVPMHSRSRPARSFMV